jgi:hypothetical protein
MSQQHDKQRPVAQFRSRNIRVSVWLNNAQKDGRMIRQYSVRVEKCFRKKHDGNYEATNRFFPAELPVLQLLVQKAFEYTTLAEHRDVRPATTCPVRQRDVSIESRG